MAAILVVLCWLLLFITYMVSPSFPLNVTLHDTNHGTSVSVSLECSRKCESEYCALPPLLRYGKYCGLLYSGCPGEKPCDGLDGCCMMHDACVRSNHDDYLNDHCNQKLLNCISAFKNSGSSSFQGNKCSVDEVIDVISVIMKAAILAGRIYHKP